VVAAVLDGLAAAAAVKAELAGRVAALAERGVTAGLGTLLVGDDPELDLAAARRAGWRSMGIVGG